jgi:hypothetical protein
MAVTKMVTNYDNQYIFSGSEDGSFAFISIIDKDLRKKDPIPTIQATIEEMVSRMERETLLGEIAHMRNDFNH